MCYFQSKYKRDPLVSISLKVREPFFFFGEDHDSYTTDPVMFTMELQHPPPLLFIMKDKFVDSCVFVFFFFSNRS